MVREYLRGLALAFALGPTAACSLVLDFSDSQIPIDASVDAPYTQDQCDYLEPNDSFAGAVMIEATEMGTAAICANDSGEDHDFYKFTVPANTATVAVQILFTNRSTGDLDLRLFDSSGTKLAQSVGFVDNETITCPAASPACSMLAAGDYVFEVFPALLGATNNYSIALTLTPM